MELTFEVRAYDDADVTRMTVAVQVEYVAMYGGPDAAAVEPEQFAPPEGLFVVGLLDGNAVAMGGWRRRADAPGSAEIKRMYVAPQVRGRGLGALVLAELERRATQAGVHRVELNTGLPQRPAIALYRNAGYTATTPFGHYRDSTDAVFLGKEL